MFWLKTQSFNKWNTNESIGSCYMISNSFVVLDVLKPLQHKRLIEKELEGFGIRLNKEPPQIGFRKKEKGGINLQVLCQQSELDLDLVIIRLIYTFDRLILIGRGRGLFDWYATFSLLGQIDIGRV